MIVYNHENDHIPANYRDDSDEEAEEEAEELSEGLLRDRVNI